MQSVVEKMRRAATLGVSQAAQAIPRESYLCMAIHHFDLVVIGSGPAGERGAVLAASLGRKVAVIEKQQVLGGTVANQGTLPSKSLRETAAYAFGFRQRGIHGMTLRLEEHVSTQELLYRERLVRQLEQARIRSIFESAKISLYHGTASFIDPHTLRVKNDSAGGREEFVTADSVLIATGGKAQRPAMYPKEHPMVHDAETITNMAEIPKSLAIIGGGVIGCEYACIFASLGVHVTLVDEHARLLPFLDAEISMALLGSMRAQSVDARLDEGVVGFKAGGMMAMALRSGSVLSSHAVLIATGRRGNSDELDAAAVGISVSDNGLIRVNEAYQTTQPHIYAVGDVVGFPSLASSAREQAQHAVLYAFGKAESKPRAQVQPYGIYTIPECSMAGETEESLTRQGIPWLAGVAHFIGNARGQIIGARTGLLKLLYHRETLALLGVHIIGEQAAELLHVGLVAMQCGAKADLFDSMNFNYPTLGELYKTATQDAMAKKNRPASPASLLKPRS